MPASSVAIAIAPPSASTSLTRWPLPMPPIDGLQDIWPSVSMLWVSSSVRRPMRAAASAASVPAWPPPTTMTSNCQGMHGGRAFYASVPRGTSTGPVSRGTTYAAVQRYDPNCWCRRLRFSSKAAGKCLPSLAKSSSWECSSSRQAERVDLGQLAILVRRNLLQPCQFRSSKRGMMPSGVSTPCTLPSQRRAIHCRTRMFSPKPGQMNFPFASRRNQFTRKIFGGLLHRAASF